MRVDMGLPADRMLAAGSRLPSVGADPSQTAVCTLTTVPAGHKCGGEGERESERERERERERRE